MVVPRYIAPMKAALGELPVATGWTFEIKWDGMRAITCIDPSDPVGLRMWSGNEIDITHRFPELELLGQSMGGARAVIDGELVALADDGRPSFSRMQSRMHIDRAADARQRAAEVSVSYMVFDLLLLDSHDLTALPLSARRGALDEVFEPGPHWQLSELHDDGHALNDAVHELQLEGLMAKRLDSVYLPGKRTTSWRKVKRRIEQNFVVGGWAEGEGGRKGRIGGLFIGGYRDGALVYAGRVGSGLRDDEIGVLSRTFADLRRDASPFAPGSVPRTEARVARWVEPQLVISVAFAEWTNEGRVRHPAYQKRVPGADPHAVSLPDLGL
ncbi:MAG: non-homologous end-joining DNA ligase [Acidimicrobiales bacterium]